MYEQVFENFCKATDSAIQVQREMFRTWATFVGGNMPQPSVARVQAIQKKWADAIADLAKKQQGTLETQFQAGQKMIEEALGITTAKDPEEFRARLIESWKKGFDCLRQTATAQLDVIQAAVAKTSELVAKSEEKATPVGSV